jgi:hypothetical protein
VGLLLLLLNVFVPDPLAHEVPHLAAVEGIIRDAGAAGAAGAAGVAGAAGAARIAVVIATGGKRADVVTIEVLLLPTCGPR